MTDGIDEDIGDDDASNVADDEYDEDNGHDDDYDDYL